MTIPTQLSLHGFIATAPELSKPDSKHARFFARVGVEHWGKEADGSFTKLDPTFHNLVMYGASAKHAYARFRVGTTRLIGRNPSHLAISWNSTHPSMSLVDPAIIRAVQCLCSSDDMVMCFHSTPIRSPSL